MNRVSVGLGRKTIKGSKLRFMYVNYKLEREQRTCIVPEIWFGSSDLHQGEQWFLKGYCLDRQEVRHFAMRDMTDVTEIYDGSSSRNQRVRVKQDG